MRCSSHPHHAGPRAPRPMPVVRVMTIALAAPCFSKPTSSSSGQPQPCHFVGAKRRRLPCQRTATTPVSLQGQSLCLSPIYCRPCLRPAFMPLLSTAVGKAHLHSLPRRTPCFKSPSCSLLWTLSSRGTWDAAVAGEPLLQNLSPTLDDAVAPLPNTTAVSQPLAANLSHLQQAVGWQQPAMATVG